MMLWFPIWKKQKKNIRRINMKYNRMYVENRIAKLKTNPIENANLIRKWERILRKCEE